MILIKGGLLKTMSGADIPNGEVLISDDGKIADVGINLEIPSGTQVINAEDSIISPGFVEGHCHIGMKEEGIQFEGDDVDEISDAVVSNMRGIDSFNPFDTALPQAVAGGITTAVVGPGSANVICGTFFAVKTHGRCVDDMVIKNPTAMKCAFGENPKKVFGAMKKAPGTRMAIAAIMRETLQKAKDYCDEYTAYEMGKREKKPAFDAKLHALIPVIRKEIPLKAHAHRADDICTSIRIAKEFDVDMTIDHCTEGYLVAEEIARSGKEAFVGQIFGSKNKYEQRNKSIENTIILNKAGIKFSLITDSPVTPLHALPYCAALAVRAGLPEDVAWKAITINPAEMTGIADRVGSLEKGKDADIIIIKGHPFKDVDFRVTHTFIDGKLVFEYK